LRSLLELAVVAAAQAAELAEGLEVRADVMARRAADAADDLLAERGGGTDPASYLGAAESFVDEVLKRWERTR
jgi:3-carboxy-cis,cis-muconate cycloisomerase